MNAAKQIKNIIFLVLLVIYLAILSGSITDRENTARITDLKVYIMDSINYQFISVADVTDMLDRYDLQPIGKPTQELNLKDIEGYLKESQIIKSAEVYITEPGILNVDITQKNPFIRIMKPDGRGYYLDREGHIIALSENFSPFVMIASGNIREPFSIQQTANIFSMNYDSLAGSQRTLYDLYKLALFIDDNELWKSQIEQIFVNRNNDFELVPRVGPHIIEFGKAENIEEKFENLRLVYTQGFRNLGWNQYVRINLKYKNQVVCTKIQ